MKARLVVLLAALCSLCLAVPAHAVVRSEAVKWAFVRLHACPSSGLHKLPCPGYILDHKESLDCGGRDSVDNLQWQTLAASRAKDLWERNGVKCLHRTHGAMPATVRKP